MSDQKVRRNNLIKKWEYLCLICGHEVEIQCATIEHIIPQSKVNKLRGRGHKKWDNKAVSHYFCNNWRGNKSLIWAMQNIGPVIRDFGYKVLFQQPRLGIKNVV